MRLASLGLVSGQLFCKWLRDVAIKLIRLQFVMITGRTEIILLAVRRSEGLPGRASLCAELGSFIKLWCKTFWRSSVTERSPQLILIVIMFHPNESCSFNGNIT